MVIPATKVDLNVARAEVGMDQISRDDARPAERICTVALLLLIRIAKCIVHGRIIHQAFSCFVEVFHLFKVSACYAAAVKPPQQFITVGECLLSVRMLDVRDSIVGRRDIERSVPARQITFTNDVAACIQ